MIRGVCGACSTGWAVPTTHGGGTAKCPTCGNVFTVPIPTALAVSTISATGHAKAWRLSNSTVFGLTGIAVLAIWGVLATSGDQTGPAYQPLVALVSSTLIVAGILIYLAPTIVAAQAGHPNTLPIFIVNFLFGWTLLGWGVALAWALAVPDRRR